MSVRRTPDNWLLRQSIENLQFIRYLVDTRKAEGKRLVFTFQAEGEPRIKHVELRNGVLVITDVGSKAAVTST